MGGAQQRRGVGDVLKDVVQVDHVDRVQVGHRRRREEVVDDLLAQFLARVLGRRTSRFHAHRAPAALRAELDEPAGARADIQQ